MQYYYMSSQKSYSTPHCACNQKSNEIKGTNCRYGFKDTLCTFFREPYLSYIDPATFTFYTPYLTTSQDATSITNVCNCSGDLLQFESSLPYSYIPLCDLSAFSVLAKNPLTSFPELKQLLAKLFPYNTYYCNSYYNNNSYDCLAGVKNYLLSQATPLNLLVNSNDFFDLTLIGTSGQLACFIQTGVTPGSPPVPYIRIVVICIDNIAALGTQTLA